MLLTMQIIHGGVVLDVLSSESSVEEDEVDEQKQRHTAQDDR